MKPNFMLAGGFFFLAVGLLAIFLIIARGSWSGLVGFASPFGGSIFPLLGIVVGILMIRLGEKRGKYGKKR